MQIGNRREMVDQVNRQAERKQPIRRPIAPTRPAAPVTRMDPVVSTIA
jgi:hypothetical protein